MVDWQAPQVINTQLGEPSHVVTPAALLTERFSFILSHLAEDGPRARRNVHVRERLLC